MSTLRLRQAALHRFTHVEDLENPTTRSPVTRTRSSSSGVPASITAGRVPGEHHPPWTCHSRHESADPMFLTAPPGDPVGVVSTRKNSTPAPRGTPNRGPPPPRRPPPPRKHAAGCSSTCKGSRRLASVRRSVRRQDAACAGACSWLRAASVPPEHGGRATCAGE